MRADSVPNDTVVVLHFGEGSSRAIRMIADEVVDRHDYWHGVLDARGRFAVSVYTLDGISEEGIASVMPHSSYGHSTVGAVRQAGFMLVRSSIDFDRMPPDLRRIQPWHSTVFLRLDGFEAQLSEEESVADSLISGVRAELAELFALFVRTENQYRGR